MNLVQVISNTLCNDKENVLLLKFNDKPKSYYHNWFEEIEDNDKRLNHGQVAKHYDLTMQRCIISFFIPTK